MLVRYAHGEIGDFIANSLEILFSKIAINYKTKIFINKDYKNNEIYKNKEIYRKQRNLLISLFIW